MKLESAYYIAGIVVALTSLASLVLSFLTFRSQSYGKAKPKIKTNETKKPSEFSFSATNSPKQLYEDKSYMPRLSTALYQWFFSLIMSGSLPLITAYLFLEMRNMPVNIVSLFSRGELVLVSCGISASGIASVVSMAPLRKWPSVLSVFSCLTVVIMSSFVSTVVFHGPSESAIKPEEVALTSLFLYLFNLLASASCFILVAMSERRYKH